MEKRAPFLNEVQLYFENNLTKTRSYNLFKLNKNPCLNNIFKPYDWWKGTPTSV